MSAAAYLFGRPISPLSPVASSEDRLFASERLDGQALAKVTYENCTFANISFKDASIANVRFSNCVFLDCYFRGTKIYDSYFSACKFIDCNLAKVDIRGSDLRYYNTFVGCHVPYGTIQESLPSEGNLRAHLCMNLSDEARRAGQLKDADKFRQAAARGLEQHLSGAVFRSSEYYKAKFRGFNYWGALIELLASKARGRLWGYQRSFLVVLRNWALLTLVIFPALFGLVRRGLEVPGKDSVGLGDVLTASAGNMLPGSGISNVEFVSSWARTFAFLEVLTGLILTGISAALLFRAIFDRVR